MKVIHKQILDLTPIQTLSLPADSEILSIQNQNENICVWYMFSHDYPKKDRIFHLFGTGHREIPNDLDLKLKHLASVQMSQGQFVWHIFIEVKQTK